MTGRAARILFLVLLTWIQTWAPAASATPDSRSLAASARAFFQGHGLFWTEAPARDLYSPEFEHLLRLNSDCVRQGESCAIDWDFWSAGQDRGALRFRQVLRVVPDGPHRVVEVAYDCHCGDGRRTRLTAKIVFLKVAGDWRVDDVRHGTSSARDALSRHFPER